ncbi:membrane peptidoglycan carboxypeptidase [Microbacterium resistens]|uniref:Membrane peptidoglycan carboxypeptidase n=1 Tax=Microbacterium resistens TaxID=156977 RepID=A0ABU1SDM6_9MICO|nr:transglycosylase domain-containing protein [Microbacterium resistens]MDR6867721.1 membrane peptidoglycan carboxypeptidase [Microbacterium resistens]
MPQTKRTLTGVLGGLAGLVGLSAVAGILVTATVTPVFAVAGATAAQSIDLFENLPSNLKVNRPMEPTTIYASAPDGSPVPLARFYDQNRSPVGFDQVAPVMYDALLSSEDKNYYDHGGIDLFGTTKALLDNLRGTSTRGGSSISQQYVKNVLLQECERGVTLDDPERDAKLGTCWDEAASSAGSAGIARKLQEMRYSIQIEKEYSKNDILIGYLNLVNFGGITYGIEAAAQRYFGVSASALSLGQAATLAGLVQNPNSFRIDMPEGSMSDEAGNPINSAADGYSQTLTRRDYVLGRMLTDGKITQEQHDAAAAEPITPNIVAPTQGCAAAGANAYFCQYVKTTLENDPTFGATPEERYDNLLRGGLDVYTSLSLPIQQAGIQAMTEYAPPSIEGLHFGAAGTTIESGTGRVLAMVQNTTFSEDLSLDGQPGYSSLVYAADSEHGSSSGFPVGSSYKIFTLIDWLEKGHSLNESLNGTNRIFNRMTCDGSPLFFGTDIVRNFGGDKGFTGTPMEFTAKSLNSGYFAMAEKLNVCDINRVADRMGVKLGNGGKVTDQNVPFDVLGSKAIAPLDMAAAMGAIGNGGTRCTPHGIDKIIGPDGTERAVPPVTCTQVVDKEVAATAAYALEGVMNGGGTGVRSNPEDGSPVIGKTGSHNDDQTTMVMSTSKTATAVWVGQSLGAEDLANFGYNGVDIPNTRHQIAPALQRAADGIYPGDRFPGPSNNLLRRQMTDLPNVVGMSQEQATHTLENAGFDVSVGGPIDSALAAGVIAAQDPGAGQAPGGAVVTISPSNGQGVPVPDVTGRPPTKAAEDLKAAGFPNVALGTCTAGSGGAGTVTSTAPAAGTVVSKGATISLNYSKQNCP